MLLLECSDDCEYSLSQPSAQGHSRSTWKNGCEQYVGELIDYVWKCGIAKVCCSLDGCCRKAVSYAVAYEQTTSAYLDASYKRYLIPRKVMSERNLVKKQACGNQILQQRSATRLSSCSTAKGWENKATGIDARARGLAGVLLMYIGVLASCGSLLSQPTNTPTLL